LVALAGRTMMVWHRGPPGFPAPPVGWCEGVQR